MKYEWTTGNRFRLLENGEEYFPRLIAAIDAARATVLLETFILFEDDVGNQLADALARAARRGVQVALTVDGFGTADLSTDYIARLTEAGVVLRLFSPGRRLLGKRTNLFRRLHRKLVAVDASLAFVGGINLSVEHLVKASPLSKQDYAVEVHGPAAQVIHSFMLEAIDAGATGPHARRRRRLPRPGAGDGYDPALAGAALLVTRDNQDHRNDIERHYLMAIRAARREVIIANAYFLPGYRLLEAICAAAGRGVDVCLILQGRPDMLWVKRTVDMLYARLREAGVRIFEYCERPNHSKVAVVDDDWATVGSSNLDPLSLSLNLEANLIIRDAEFVATLKHNLRGLMSRSCTEVSAADHAHGRWWHRIATPVIFHFLRKFPAWAGWLPAHTPRLVAPEVPTPAEQSAAMPVRPVPPVQRVQGDGP
ncbi:MULTISPECIES: cardiolipin synthase ClsB [Cupriavidus]|uniref:Cardiolipin synthase B n=1 Tax=Cupriavidus pauculus TaxID=82633 RepID=A0A3G8H7S2_9BURK|nr:MULTISPECIES: cardiolipin synthase ClsB [Cupriavidus]AZG16613.1 cardiolipin synthase ClsB [Cupriavidus pauculus]MDT6961123.1 cardiolipin synthase ClsB [Cupriavidus sp. SZY C1]